jgi:restriction system protein
MRKSHPLVELSHLPWWTSAVVAALAFGAARWLAPALAKSRPMLAPLAATAADHAFWLGGIFLLPIPFALVHAARRRRLAATPAKLGSINAMSWQDFEALVAEVYRRRGYKVVSRGGGSADGGVDIELRAKGKTIVVQCKRWRTQVVGVDRVRELFGAMAAEHASAAIMVSSGRYTPDAIEFARGKPMELVDGGELVTMLAGVQASRSTRPVSGTTTILAETGVGAADANGTKARAIGESVACPKCGSAMIRRVAKQGVHAGSAFWGCSRFPGCRGTLSAE